MLHTLRVLGDIPPDSGKVKIFTKNIFGIKSLGSDFKLAAPLACLTLCFCLWLWPYGYFSKVHIGNWFRNLTSGTGSQVFSIPTVVQDSHIMNGPLQCTDTKRYMMKFTCTDNLLQAKTKMPDEIENLFSLMDFAHNGKISEQEFLAATGHYRSPRFIFWDFFKFFNFCWTVNMGELL